MTERKLPTKQRKFNYRVGRIGKRAISSKFGKRIKGKLVKDIWKSYIEILGQELIDEGSIEMPCNIGTINVFKYPIATHPKYMKGILAGSKAPQSTNLNRINYIYQIKYKRGPNVKWVRFQASQKLKAALKLVLNNTDKEYRPAPIKVKNEYK